MRRSGLLAFLLFQVRRVEMNARTSSEFVFSNGIPRYDQRWRGDQHHSRGNHDVEWQTAKAFSTRPRTDMIRSNNRIVLHYNIVPTTERRALKIYRTFEMGSPYLFWFRSKATGLSENQPEFREDIVVKESFEYLCSSTHHGGLQSRLSVK